MRPTTKAAAAVTDESTALPVVQVMLSTTAGATTTKRSQAATYGLVFGEPPPRRRTTGTATTGGRASRRRVERLVAPASHRPHGTHAKYVVERCGCEPCREANRDYERRRGQAIARPDKVWMPYVPAGPARRRVAELREHGVGLKTVSRLSGVSHGALSKIIYGDPRRGQAPSRRVRPQTLAAILRVRLDQAQGGQKVPAGPTWALLGELLVAGYTKVFLARRAGLDGHQPHLAGEPGPGAGVDGPGGGGAARPPGAPATATPA